MRSKAKKLYLTKKGTVCRPRHTLVEGYEKTIMKSYHGTVSVIGHTIAKEGVNKQSSFDVYIYDTGVGCLYVFGVFGCSIYSLVENAANQLVKGKQ